MDDLSEILEKVDMTAYLDSEGIVYRETRGSRGEQLNVKECPVCGNEGWKVYLNADSGLGNCFAGDHPPNANFNKWRFIKAHCGDIPGRQLVEHIKQFARTMGWRPPRTKSVAVNNVVSEWKLPDSIPLPHKGRNLPYLDNRGITSTIARYFNLRYATDGAHFRYKVAGDWHFQDYSRRIIVPIYDLEGNLVTFQGRDVTGKAEKKYLFPPMLEGSGAFLFNGLNVHNTKRVVIGEGVFDVAAIKIALDTESELRDVVPIGTFGKHLSYLADSGSQLEKMLVLKARGIEEVTIMWDGELAATDEAVKAGEMLTQHGFRVRIAMLPADKDPNEVPPHIVLQAYYSAIALDRLAGVRIRILRRNMNDGQSPVSK